jgi:hypothetical protein
MLTSYLYFASGLKLYKIMEGKVKSGGSLQPSPFLYYNVYYGRGREKIRGII